MTQWEYEIIRMDTLELFRGHLALAGKQGWEALSANHVLQGPETLEGKTYPPRHVWIAVLKRPLEEA